MRSFLDFRPARRKTAGRQQGGKRFMTIYRADPRHGVAWVTGGSTGIGRALALELARAGYTVAVSARYLDPLDGLIRQAATFGGRIAAFPCDVTDEAAMAATVAAIEDAHGPLVLAVFNAGTYGPVRGEALDIAGFRRVYEVNVFGVLNGLAPVVERMRGRGRGQVVLVGSATSWFGLPLAAAYGSSKTALNRMAESLRHDFVKLNIRIQVVNPGFVETPLTEGLEVATPGMMSARKAAARIARIIAGGGFETSFPRRLTVWVRLLALMPAEVRHRVVAFVTKWNGYPPRPSAGRPSDEV
jgi:NAD(P)-dependent dehydrogenase (short-subunit alcohol dehydrogenase family)